MPDKTRFEREIDEILEKSGDETKPEPTRQRQFEPFSPKTPKRKSPVMPGAVRFSPGSVIILGVVILALAAFTAVAKLPLAIVGALIVTVGYVTWFRRGGSSFGRASGRTLRRRARNRPAGDSAGSEPRVKYWRGRRIEEKPDSPDPSDSGDPKGQGKIIEFGPSIDDLDPSDRGQGKK